MMKPVPIARPRGAGLRPPGPGNWKPGPKKRRKISGICSSSSSSVDWLRRAPMVVSILTTAGPTSSTRRVKSRSPGGGPGGGDRQRHRGGGGGNQQDQGEGGDRCFHRDGFSDSTRTGRARGPKACAAGGAARGRCADIMHATGSGLARVRRGRFARIGGRRPGQGLRRGGQERFEYRRARGQAATGNG